MSNNEALKSAEAALSVANIKLRSAKNLRDDEVRASAREIHDRHEPAVTKAMKNVAVETEAYNAALVASKLWNPDTSLLSSGSKVQIAISAGGGPSGGVITKVFAVAHTEESSTLSTVTVGGRRSNHDR